MGQISASATLIGPQQPAAGESVEPRLVVPRPRCSSSSGNDGAGRDDGAAAAIASHAARRSLAQTLRTLSDDEEYAAGGSGCLFWHSSSSDSGSDEGLLALAGASTQGIASGASSETPPRCSLKLAPPY